MVPLDDSSLTVSLATLDDLRHVAVDLEDPLLAVPLLQPANPHILQRDDTLGHVLRRVLKVVETTVVQHEPTALPALPTPTLELFRIK